MLIGARVSTLQIPFEDQGSEIALPVRCIPTKSFGCNTHRVFLTISGSCLANQNSFAGQALAAQGKEVPIISIGFPYLASKSWASLVARLSCQVITGRSALPALSTQTTEGVCPESPIAITLEIRSELFFDISTTASK